jgi:hypothetical protein
VATIRHEGDELVVKLNDLEKAGALRGEVRVPWASVRDVRATEHPFRELGGIRSPGTGIPGVIALGTYRSTGRKDFAAIYRGGPAIVVTLESAGWNRLLVSDHHAATLVEQLRGDLPERSAAGI